MPIEIERKYLVADETWRQSASAGVHIIQGYIVNANHCSVRVRICSNGKCTLTTKLPRLGISRYEFEHDIDLREAESLMEMCGDAVVEKRRHIIKLDNLVWEIDCFEGLNEGLVVAEIELEREDQTFSAPPWLGREVTAHGRYQNSKLAREPYSTWGSSLDEPANSQLETVG